MPKFQDHWSNNNKKSVTRFSEIPQGSTKLHQVCKAPGLAEIHRVLPKTHRVWVPPGQLQREVVLKKDGKEYQVKSDLSDNEYSPAENPNLLYHIGNKKLG